MSNPERSIGTNPEFVLTATLINFLSPRPGEEIILGEVTKSRARNSHFTVKLIKQEYIDENVHVVGSQVVTEKLLNSTAQTLGQILRLDIISTDEKERLALIRKKVLEIKKEARSKIKKTS